MIKGSHHTEAAIRRMKAKSEETRRRMSKAKQGKNNPMYDKHHSEETRKEMSKRRKGNKNSWKGGITHDGEGYLRFLVPEGCRFFCMAWSDGYIQLHRLIIAECLQRPLRDKEVVHHINGNIIDNRIENLKLFKSNGEHISLHRKIRKREKGGDLIGSESA